MSREAAEMPFLDHLEELRGRILRSLAALIVGIGAGIWAVQRFAVIEVLKGPIAPFLPTGNLTILSPTDPILIVLKLGALFGVVLASPVIIWQVWAFLSPALYEREKKAIVPALFAGMLLFLLGGALGFLIIVPKALSVLLSIQAGNFDTMITYDRYFGFVLQIVLAMGISFELPLIMIIMGVLGVVTPAMLSRFRRHAVVLAFVGGALLSPGPDLFSMMLMTLPLILLYEVGLAGVKVVHRRRLKRAAATAATLLVLCLGAGISGAAAQEPPPPPPPPQQRVSPTATLDSLRRVTNAIRDSAARRLGLPTAPSAQFMPTDSVMRDLLDRLGFTFTRFRADSAHVRADDGAVELRGRAMTEREGATLEADAITYRQDSCLLLATGNPKLFGQGSPVIGDTVRFDTCRERGVIQAALTTLEEQGANWFVRGNLAIDSSATRAYAEDGQFTSCDLPVPHYYFAVKQIKWVSRSMLVARPAVLYIRDVPIIWLPFIFQDTKPGRRSGILPPQFGFNDIVRPNSRYNRQVTGAGYYFAPNDYMDVAAKVDWYANRYFEWTLDGSYKWLDRFTTGQLAYSRRRESEGANGWQLRWNHQQNFNLTTSLTASVNYMSNTSIVNRNAIDPLVSIQQVNSSINLQRRLPWGTVSLGGSRRQTLSDGGGTQTLPSLTISPKPLDIGTAITWSPGFTATNSSTFGPSPRAAVVVRPDGGVDTLRAELDSRTT
ncbi:MAG: twin-arginine translocase subunit TatC, partial [Gemmatimonadales bacterium]